MRRKRRARCGCPWRADGSRVPLSSRRARFPRPVSAGDIRSRSSSARTRVARVAIPMPHTSSWGRAVSSAASWWRSENRSPYRAMVLRRGRSATAHAFHSARTRPGPCPPWRDLAFPARSADRRAFPSAALLSQRRKATSSSAGGPPSGSSIARMNGTELLGDRRRIGGREPRDPQPDVVTLYLYVIFDARERAISRASDEALRVATDNSLLGQSLSPVPRCTRAGVAEDGAVRSLQRPFPMRPRRGSWMVRGAG